MIAGRMPLAALALSTLAACSPDPYSDPVKTFASNESSSGTLLEQLTSDMTAAHVRLVNYQALYHGPRPSLKPSASCLGPASDDVGEPCQEVPSKPGAPLPAAVPAGAGPAAAPVAAGAPAKAATLATLAPPQSIEGYTCPELPVTGAPPATETGKAVTTRRIEKTLKDYAAALTAITNASDRAALDSAFGDLSKSVSAMASTVGMAGGPALAAAAGAIAGPSVSLIGWVTGTIEDRRRLDALTATLRITCLPMQTISATVAGMIHDRTDAAVADRLSTIQLLEGPARDPADYFQRHQEVAAIMAEGLNSAAPTNAGTAMGAAHDALVKAVLNREGQTKALADAMSNFAKSVSDLEAAVNKPSKS